MQPFAADVFFLHIRTEILRQLFGQCGNQNTFMHGGSFSDLIHQMMNLTSGGNDKDFRIHETGRPNHLLHDFATGLIQFPIARGCRHEHTIRWLRVPLVKLQRSIILRHGQSKTMIDQSCFASIVASKHGSNLRQCDVRFVDKNQKLFRKKVIQRVGRFARFSPSQSTTVVFNSGAESCFFHKLQIMASSRGQTLSLQQLALLAKLLQSSIQLFTNLIQCRVDSTLGKYKVLGRIDVNLFQRLRFLARDWVDHAELFNLIAPQLDAIGELLVSGPDFDHIAPNSELGASRIEVIAFILDVDQLHQ